MSALAFIEERVLFSPHIPQAVNSLLQVAVAASQLDPVRAETVFLKALVMAPQCLQAYFALYKFYFYQKRLSDAERIVESGLDESAKQGDFPNDLEFLATHPQQWDFYANESTLFYLYTLKALAFIKLRQGFDAEAGILLSLLKQLDPEDRSGASVIMELAQGVKGD